MLAATTRDVQVPGNPACVQDFPTAAAADPNAIVVMCGLDNPRGLAFSEFALFVAEAGRGGLGVTAAPCFTGNAAPMANNRCYAPTGAISRLWNGSQERVATGFPSHANLLGRMAIGPNDIAVSPALGAGGGGSAFVAIGLQQPPAFRTHTHSWLTSPSLLAWTLTANGVTPPISVPTKPRTIQTVCTLGLPKLDTNPYGLIANGRNVVVTDAGGNSMLRVVPGGDDSTAEHIVTVAVFPSQHLPDLRRRCGAYVDCHRSGRRLLRMAS